LTKRPVPFVSPGHCGESDEKIWIAEVQIGSPTGIEREIELSKHG
jgi:hypothetical protein